MAWAGRLNEEIEIWDITTRRNDYGEDEQERSKIYTTRAQTIYSGGSRTVLNDEVQVPYSKRFITRKYVPVTETSWIKWKDRFYRVTSIEESREWQELLINTQLVIGE